jgi:hypothetical protein
METTTISYSVFLALNLVSQGELHRVAHKPTKVPNGEQLNASSYNGPEPSEILVVMESRNKCFGAFVLSPGRPAAYPLIVLRLVYNCAFDHVTAFVSPLTTLPFVLDKSQ